MEEFYKDIAKLKEVVRRGWKFRNFKTSRTESDAEHVFSMLMLAFYILSKNNSTKLDGFKIFKLILFHELGEIEVGDITPFDNYDIDLKHKQEKSVVKRISKKYNIEEISELWNEYNDRKTLESRFVKLLDHLDYLCQANVYKEENDEQFQTLYNEYVTKHPDVIEEFKKYGE